MRKHSVLKFLTAVWVSTAILTSCTSDVDLSDISKDIKIDQALTLPVAEANITIEDFLNQLVSDSLVGTVGNEIIFQTTDSSEYKFREIDMTQKSMPITNSPDLPVNAVPYPANTAIPTISSDAELDLGLNTDPATERIDSVNMASATLEVKVSVSNLNIAPSNLKFTLSFPSDKMRMLDGSPTDLVFSPTAYDQTIPLAVSDFAINTYWSKGIPVHIKLEARTGSSSVLISNLSKIDIQFKFNNINWRVAYGYFVPSVNASNTIQIPLDITKSLPNSNMKFANPKATVSILSNIGTFLRFKVDYVKAFNKSDPSTSVKASFDGNEYSVYDFPRPAKPGDWVSTGFVMDKANGAIDKLFDSNINPNMLEYKFSSLINTALTDQNPTLANFVTPDGMIKAYVKTEIPLQLKAGSSFEVKDTIRNIGKDIVKLEQATLILKVTNGLPTKLTYSMVFLDSSGIPISSSFNDLSYIIKAPLVSAEGVVSNVPLTPETIKIELTKAQILELAKAKDLQFMIRFEGQDANQPMHFTKTNSFGVKIGVFAKGNTTEGI